MRVESFRSLGSGDTVPAVAVPAIIAGGLIAAVIAQDPTAHAVRTIV